MTSNPEVEKASEEHCLEEKTQNIRKKPCWKKMASYQKWIFLGVFVGCLLLHIPLIIVRITHDNNLVNMQQQLNDLQKGLETKDTMNMAHFDLHKPTLHNVPEVESEVAEYIITGFRADRQIGNSIVHLKERQKFIVQKDGVFSIHAKVAFAGKYRNSVIGIYIDDLLCDKGLSSASLSEEGYMNVLSCEAKCLHVDLQEGQAITIRSFHDRNIYRSEKTSWVHFERHN